MQRKAEQPAAEIARQRAQRAQYATLTAHYGKIGSGALNAALLHAKCAKEKAQTQAQAQAQLLEHVSRKWEPVSG